ncbi:hypothetical protein EV714DRAFT_285618 [Schizophyllum commune]
MSRTASAAKRKPARRPRILSEAPDDEQAVGEVADVAEATAAEGDDNEDDGRLKNAFVDDEAVEDNEEEDPEDDDMADFIDDGEPTDGKLGSDDNVGLAEGGAGVDAEQHAFDEENANDSDGEHSVHDDDLEFDGLRPAAQYFGGFKPNLASEKYQALARDAVSQTIGISDYAYANGAYKSVHFYKTFPKTSTSAWKPAGGLDFPDLQESMESLYPAFSTMKIVCDAINFSACAGYINLARANPSRFSFVTGEQKKDGTLSRVNDPKTPAYFITVGLVRQCFIGPNGLELEGGYRRGITLAPFECEVYRAIACLNQVGGMKGANHFTFPLYAHGGFAFTTKTMSGDGNRPIVPGWTTPQSVRRSRPELVSDRSTARQKPGVLGYIDEIPVVDARRKRVVWGTDTLAQIVNSEIWPRFIGNLERDSVAVVVYTVNRWGRESMDRIAFNIHSIVLVADPLETTSAAAAAKIRRDYLATKEQPSKKRLTHDRPSEGGSGEHEDAGKKAKTGE